MWICGTNGAAVNAPISYAGLHKGEVGLIRPLTTEETHEIGMKGAVTGASPIQSEEAWKVRQGGIHVLSPFFSEDSYPSKTSAIAPFLFVPKGGKIIPTSGQLRFNAAEKRTMAKEGSKRSVRKPRWKIFILIDKK